jgi:hypothetical protein
MVFRDASPFLGAITPGLALKLAGLMRMPASVPRDTPFLSRTVAIGLTIGAESAALPIATASQGEQGADD